MRIDELVQTDPFGEKLITITARNLNASQISTFVARMRAYELPSKHGNRASLSSKLI